MVGESFRSGRRRTVFVPASTLFIISLLLSLGGALFYAWVINPIIYTQATPADLGTEFRAEYIYLVSQSYLADNDWTKTESRLAALEETEIDQVVGEQLENYLRQGKPAIAVQSLAHLALDLEVESPAVALFAPMPAQPSPTLDTSVIIPTFTPTLLPTFTPTPLPSNTPAPTLTPTNTPLPTATSAPIYRLLNQQRACRFDQPGYEIEVVVLDALLQPLSGVEVLVSWENGSDHFFTGFQPDEEVGYGDFMMEAEGVSYTVVLAEGSPTVSGLRPEPCSSREGGLVGGWRLTYQRLILDVTSTPEP